MRKFAFLILLSFAGLTATAQKQSAMGMAPTEPSKQLSTHTQEITCIITSPDGRFFYTASRDNSIKEWDAATYTETKTLVEHKFAPVRMAISADGKLLLSGSLDGLVVVWDLEQGKMSQRFRNHNGPVAGLAFSNDATNRYIYTAGEDGNIHIYDRNTLGKNVDNFETGVTMTALVMDPLKNKFYTGAQDGKVRVYDSKSGELIKTYEGPHAMGLNCLTMSRDGKMLASSGNDKKIMLWDTAAGKATMTMEGHEWKVFSVYFNRSNEYLVSSSNDGTVRTWSLETGKWLKAFNLQKRKTWFAAIFSPKTDQVIGGGQVNAPGDASVYVWESGLTAKEDVFPPKPVVAPTTPVKKPAPKR